MTLSFEEQKLGIFTRCKIPTDIASYTLSRTNDVRHVASFEEDTEVFGSKDPRHTPSSPFILHGQTAKLVASFWVILPKRAGERIKLEVEATKAMTLRTSRAPEPKQGSHIPRD